MLDNKFHTYKIFAITNSTHTTSTYPTLTLCTTNTQLCSPKGSHSAGQWCAESTLPVCAQRQ